MSANTPDSEILQPIRRRLAETTANMTRALVEDLASYPERELQRRFVDAEAADELTDAQVTQLRKQARELGQRFSSGVQIALSRPEPWEALLGQDAEIEDIKSLRAVPAVWMIVSAIDGEVETLAKSVGLPPDLRTPPGYAQPMRFIQRLHLPTLVEHYIRDLREYARLSSELQVQTAEQRRRSRAERWAASQD
ncbi:MAG: hypothetical protein ACOYOB_04170 [Myxococcota bacterium]